MIFTKTMIGLGFLLYVGLWVLAVHGATSLVPVLVIPVALVALIAGGAWITRTLGLSPKPPRFRDPDDGES